VFPEIPCSFRGAWAGLSQYHSCVKTALDELVRRGVLDERARARFLFSALRAFAVERLKGLGVESDPSTSTSDVSPRGCSNGAGRVRLARTYASPPPADAPAYRIMNAMTQTAAMHRTAAVAR
jgi:hypothetical protein